jgi:hypothetical protein
MTNGLSWIVEFYEDSAGCPVREYLDTLDQHRRAKVLAIIKLLEEEGPDLPFPYSSQVSGKLRELRAQFAGEQFRVLYFGDPVRRFVLVHAFTKHTRKLPARDIEVAKSRMAKWLDLRTRQRGRR